MKVIDVLSETLRRKIKATRRIPKGKIHPSGTELRRFEREGAEAIARALAKLKRDLFAGLNADTIGQVLTRLDDPAITRPLHDAIALSVSRWALAGADFGREQIERAVFGTKQNEIPINWDLANQAAIDFADAYSFELVGGIDNATQNFLRNEVAGFAESGETFQAFSRRMADAPIFSPERARLIAITEVTRAYSEGNQVAWAESGVTTAKEWNTANDELVCPICGPLDGEQVRLKDDFPGGFNGPPAHPRCRCWVTPVHETDTATGQDIFDQFDLDRGPFPGFADRVPGSVTGTPSPFTVADELAFLESAGGGDRFANIRPPAGRAPAGLGTEYRQRRLIMSRIDQHEKWLGQSQAKLDVFRGQTGSRARWAQNVAKERTHQLDKGLAAMVDIANSGGDWEFISELINGIAKQISSTRI